MAQNIPDDHWQLKVDQFNQELHTLPKGKVIFLGNSITEGFDLGEAFPKSEPVNRGIISDHLDGVLARLDSSVIALQPSRLFILIGINDIGRGDKESLIVSRFDTLLSKLTRQLAGTEIYLTSILPTSSDWSNCPKEKIISINQKISGLAIKYKCRWMPIYHHFADNRGYIKSELSSDGLHLNRSGYEIWKNELLKTGLR